MAKKSIDKRLFKRLIYLNGGKIGAIGLFPKVCCGQKNQINAGFAACLGDHIADMNAHGVFTDEQILCDLRR